MSDNSDRDLIIPILFANGETLQQIGDRYGISRERVRQILRRQGISPVDGRKVRAEKAKAREAAIAELSRKSGLTTRQVRSFLRRNFLNV